MAFDVLGQLDACTLGHKGTLFDLGDTSTRHRFGGRLDPADVEVVERDGASWARLRVRTLTLRFALPDGARPAPSPAADGGTDETFVEARVRGGAARLASVYLNGKPVGSWPLEKGETRVVVARGGVGAIAPGTNELVLRFTGPRLQDGAEAVADIDWVHVGSGEHEATYAAPTRNDAVTEARAGGVARRALALRAPGFARCVALFPPGARFQAQVALQGAGEGDVEVRLHRDRRPSLVLGTAHVREGSPFVPLKLPLPEIDGSGDLGMLEIAALGATKGARILIGEPRVVVPRANPPAPSLRPARGVVLVVQSSVGPTALAPYGGPRPVPTLTALAAGGVVFEGHRAPSAVASGSLASLLTGLAPQAHGVMDPDARLPRAVPTMPEALRQAGVATAFFGANPTAGPAFGFDRGWERFTIHEPDAGATADQVYEDAARFLEERRTTAGRFFVVVHGRGAHPPWDVTPKELPTLAPTGYSGIIDAKHAAELLTHPRRNAARLTDADRARVASLHAAAIDREDAAMGRLMTALASAGLEKDTAVLVTSDVAALEGSPTPYAEGEPEGEGALTLPLVLRFPDRVASGARVKAATTVVDLARSTFAFLGLSPPNACEGEDLSTIVASGGGPTGRPLLAMGGERFLLRSGPFVLFGSGDRETRLCNTLLEPLCLTDVQGTHPLVLDGLHKAAFDAVNGGHPRRTREAATIDPTTAAALRAWGR